MGWEQRGRNVYYYRKVRREGKVVSEYVGKGEVASAISALIDADKRVIALQKLQFERKKAEIWARERALEAFCDGVEAELKRTLEAAGYHRHHRGEWRRRRGDKKDA